MFTGESKYNVCKVKPWKNLEIQKSRNPKNLIPTMMYGGGNVIVWGSMAAARGCQIDVH